MFVFITWKINIERANDVHNVNIFIREKLCLDFYYVFLCGSMCMISFCASVIWE